MQRNEWTALEKIRKNSQRRPCNNSTFHWF